MPDTRGEAMSAPTARPSLAPTRRTAPRTAGLTPVNSPRPLSKSAGRQRTVQSITRALRVLDTLADSQGEIGIVGLSRRLALHSSTVHRLLATLASHGYVRQNPDTGRYTLGSKAIRLAEAYLGQLDLRRVARPFLERLTQDTGETANLVIQEGRAALYLDKVESPRSLRIFSHIGRRAPLHCTAVGKVLLANAPPAQVDRLLGEGPLERLTKRTITSIAQLRRELAAVRTQGYALDREECEEGGYCIAAPVQSATGETVAAVGVSSPSVRMPARRVQQLVPAVVRAGREISERLGFHTPPADLRAAGRGGRNQKGR
jgi:IclR family KDG regulon transcriptional repressor